MDEQFFFNTDGIFENLNPEQANAVSCLEGPLLIMAGAGSGKTRVLTCRIANLIAQGIPPWNILAITFTNKAANEMKSRAEKLIGSSARDIVMRTFHSFCARLLRREIEITGEFTGNFAIFDAADSKSLAKKCVAELNLGESIFDNVHNKISDLKNNLIDTKTFSEQSLTANVYTRNVAAIYELYQKKLRENNALDFDDLIFTTVKIFQKFPEVLEHYQNRFKYISIDEYQDTNVAQYVLTKLLAAKYRNICVVGDADQSIYGWRGADMRNILNFEQDYPEATVVKLEQNYRSTKVILRAANAVIRNNVDRKPKTLWTENESGELIRFILCESDKVEAAIIAQEIRRLLREENFNYNDIALLYRTNAQSRMFEEFFMQGAIPYIIIGGLKFYDRMEIKDILAYLYVINNPNDSMHLMRIINTPRRGLGDTNVSRVVEFAEIVGVSVFEVVSDTKLLMQVPGLSVKFRATIRKFAAMMLSFMESAKHLPVDELIQVVIDESGYMQMLKEGQQRGKQDYISREENLGAFVNSAKDFVEMSPNSTLEDFLNHVALITDLDTVNEEDSRVRLMTVHAAKGLEFPVVFVVGMEDGLFPNGNAFGNEDAMEEERRACYVALTRAQKKLYISSALKRMYFGKIKDQSVSRFVGEIPDDCIEEFGSYQSSRRRISSPPRQNQSNYRPPTAHRAAQMLKPVEKSAPETFKPGDQITHRLWGSGVVMAVDGDYISILFAKPEIGLKKLSLSVAPIKKL